MQTSSDQQQRKQATIQYNQIIKAKEAEQKNILSQIFLQIIINPKYEQCRDYAIFALLKDIKSNGEESFIFFMEQQQLINQLNQVLQLEKRILNKQLAECLSLCGSFALYKGIVFVELFNWLQQSLQTDNYNCFSICLYILSQLCATEYKYQKEILNNQLYQLMQEYAKKAQKSEDIVKISEGIINYIDVWTVSDYAEKEQQQLQKLEYDTYQQFLQYIQDTYQQDNQCAKVIANTSMLVNTMMQDIGMEVFQNYLSQVKQLLYYKVLGDASTKQLVQSVTQICDDLGEVDQATRKLLFDLLEHLIPLTVDKDEDAQALLDTDFVIGDDVYEDDTTTAYEAVLCINVISDLIGKKKSMLSYTKFMNQQLNNQHSYQQIDQCIQYTRGVINCYRQQLRKDEIQNVTKQICVLANISQSRISENFVQWGKAVYDIIVLISELFDDENTSFNQTHSMFVEILHQFMNIQSSKILNAAVTVYDDVLQQLDFDQVYEHNQLTLNIVDNLLNGNLAMQAAGISILTTFIQFNDIQNQTQALQKYLQQIMQQYQGILGSMKQDQKFTKEQIVYIGYIVEFFGILIASNKQVLQHNLKQIVDSVIFVVEYAIYKEEDRLLTLSNQCLINLSIQASQYIADALPKLLPKLIKILLQQCSKIIVDEVGNEDYTYDSILLEQKKQVLFLITQLCLQCPQQLKGYVQTIFESIQAVLQYQETMVMNIAQLYGAMLLCICDIQQKDQQIVEIQQSIIKSLLKVLNPYHTTEIAEFIKNDNNYPTDQFDFVSAYQSFDTSNDPVELFVQVMKPIVQLDQNGEIFDKFLVCIQKQIKYADELLKQYQEDNINQDQDLAEDYEQTLKQIQEAYQERYKQIAQIFSTIIKEACKSKSQQQQNNIVVKSFQVLEECYNADCSKTEGQYKFCAIVDTIVDVQENCNSQLALQIYQTYQDKTKQVLLAELQAIQQNEVGNIDIFRTTFYLYNCLCKFQNYKQAAQDQQILGCAVQLLEILKNVGDDQASGIYDNIVMYLVNAGMLGGQGVDFFAQLLGYMAEMKGDQEEISNAISFCIDNFDRPEFVKCQKTMLNIIVSKFFGQVYGFICQYSINGYDNEEHDKYFLICNQKFEKFYQQHMQLVQQEASKLNTQYKQQNYQFFQQQHQQ